MTTRTIYTGDLERPLVIELADDDGPIDVTQPGTTVRVIGRQDGAYIFTRTNPDITTESDGTTSTVTMPWQTGDTDTAGRIEIEVKIDWAGSRPQTIRPRDDVLVIEDFGGVA